MSDLSRQRASASTSAEAMKPSALWSVVLLAVTTATSLVLPVAAQDGTRDSVQVTFKVDAWYKTEGGGYQCGAGIRAEHPDFAGRGKWGYLYNPYNSRLSFYTTEAGVVVGSIQGSWLNGWSNSGCGKYYAIAAQQTGVEMWAIAVIPEGEPVAMFDSTGGSSLMIEFDASNSYEAVDGGKVPVASYLWDFGDGSSGSTSAAPSHTYAEPGTYLVSLEVTDDDGQKDSWARNFVVAEPGLVVWAEALHADYDIDKGEGVHIVAYVENQSTEDVVDLVVPLDFLTGTIFPDSAQGKTQQPTYARITSTSRKDTTIAFLSPGERAEIEQFFVVETYGLHVPTNRQVPIEVTDYAMIMGVSAKDENGDTVRVELKCGYEPCGNTWIVRPRWVAEAEYRTDNLVTFEAKSGVEYNVDLLDPALHGFNFNPVQPFTYKFVDETLTRFCHTGCVDFRIEVKHELGNPIEGASVVVTAPDIPATANVTPDHSGGHLCKRNLATYTCGSSVTLETDEDGIAEAYYSFPGLVEEVEVSLKALVKDGSMNMLELSPTIRLKANERTDFIREVTLTRADAAYLNIATSAYAGGAAVGIVGEVCSGFSKWLTGGIADYLVRPGQLPIVHQGTNVLTEWVCGLDPIKVLTLNGAGEAKKVGETSMISWFGSRFQAPMGGLGTLTGPYPPPIVFYWDGDLYDALFDALSKKPGILQKGTTMKLSLHEVSWLQQESVLDGNINVPGVRFKLEVTAPNGDTATTEKLIEYGYDPIAWLTPPAKERLAEIAQAQADRIRVQETIDRIQRGDYIWLDASGPNAEMVRVAEVDASGGKVAGPYTLHLTRPLQHAHDADAEILIQRDSSEVGPPRRPSLITRDSLSTDKPLTLWWANGIDETPYAYDLMVARDTSFTDLVVNLSDLTEPIYELDPLEHGEELFWRARSSNLLGTGEWSQYARVVGIEGYGVATERPQLSESFELHAPYPNPAQGAATIPYEVSGVEEVRVAVYDILGREVMVLVDGLRPGGRNSVALETDHLPAGMYFVRMQHGNAVRTRSIVVLH